MTPARFLYFLFAAILLLGGAFSIGYGTGPVTATFFLLGIVLGSWVIWDSYWVHHNEELSRRADLTTERTKFVIAIGNASSDTRSFLALEWPELGVNDVEVRPAIYLLHHGMNTNILVTCFQRFLQDSGESEFADVRRYNDDKTLQDQMGISREGVRKQWTLTTEYLVKKGYLSPNSAAGSHSFLWVSKNHYYRMVKWYLHGTQNIPELGLDE